MCLNMYTALNGHESNCSVPWQPPGFSLQVDPEKDEIRVAWSAWIP